LKAYVFFHNPDYTSWWMRFLRDGMRHCSCVKSCTIGNQEYFILFENLFNYISIGAYFLTIDELIDTLNTDGITIVEYDHTIDPTQRQPYYEPISCVTTIKRILGIADWKVQTPYQLYKKLLKNGGKIYGTTIRKDR